jgi:hypothetical protein
VLEGLGPIGSSSAPSAACIATACLKKKKKLAGSRSRASTRYQIAGAPSASMCWATATVLPQPPGPSSQTMRAPDASM